MGLSVPEHTAREQEKMRNKPAEPSDPKEYLEHPRLPVVNAPYRLAYQAGKQS